jgi:hypothetical protein
MPPSANSSPTTNLSIPTRRNRVVNMLKGKKNNARTLKRGVASRHLMNTPKQFQISNNRPVFGANFNNENVNKERSNNLRNSRKSIEPSKLRYRNVRLNEKQSKLFANLSAAYNEPEEMLETLEKLQQRIFAMYGN